MKEYDDDYYYLECLGYQIIKEDIPLSSSEGNDSFVGGYVYVTAKKGNSSTVIDKWYHV